MDEKQIFNNNDDKQNSKDFDKSKSSINNNFMNNFLSPIVNYIKPFIIFHYLLLIIIIIILILIYKQKLYCKNI